MKEVPWFEPETASIPDIQSYLHATTEQTSRLSAVLIRVYCI